MNHKLISIIVLTSMLMTSVSMALPSPAQAATAEQVGSVIAQAGGCVGSGALAGWLRSKINEGLKALQKKVGEMAKGFLKGFYGSLITGLSSFLSFSVPTDSKDAGATAFWVNKEYRDMVVARCLARLQLDNISNNIANIVQTRGRDGGKAIVENWRTFQTNAQYRGENVFRAMLSTANLCPSFANDLKKSYGLKPTDKIALPGVNTRVGSTQPFSVQINCTLPKDFTIQKYQQNFASLGGWNTYALMAQPQNNLYGATLLAQGQMAVQRSLEESADIAQVQANSGYIGISGKDKNDSCKIKGPDAACIVYKNIKTSGEYLAQNVAASVGAQFAWLTTAQGLNTIIEDVTQMMINKLFDQSRTDGADLITGQEDGSGGYGGAYTGGPIGGTSPGVPEEGTVDPGGNPGVAVNFCDANFVTNGDNIIQKLTDSEITSSTNISPIVDFLRDSIQQLNSVKDSQGVGVAAGVIQIVSNLNAMLNKLLSATSYGLTPGIVGESNLARINAIQDFQGTLSYCTGRPMPVTPPGDEPPQPEPEPLPT